MPRKTAGWYVSLLAITLLAAAAGAAEAAADPREVYGPQSPRWMQAVGKLRVPGSRLEEGRRRHHVEDCTATLIAPRPARSNRWIVTAWHCLEFYTDLSRPITFTLPNAASGPVVREAFVIASGGSLAADWALLRLDAAIARERAAPLALYDAQSPGVAVGMAGFSRDEGLGAGGAALTYDAACSVTGNHGSNISTDCIAYKGASGGPVTTLDERGQVRLSGVISQGDGAGISLFFPAHRFASRLEAQAHR